MEIVARASIMFIFLWALTRAMGKRQLAEMTAFELVVLVTLGDLVQQGVTQNDMSITGAMLAVGTMGLWAITFSWITFRVPRARKLLEGIPVIIVRDGELIREALRLERLPVDDVLESARHQGIEDLADVKLAILEPDGRFSFIKSRDDDAGAPDEPSRAG